MCILVEYSTQCEVHPSCEGGNWDLNRISFVTKATCSCFCVPSRMFGLHGSSLEIINLCRDVVMISDSCKQLLLSVVGWISVDVFSPKYHQSSYCKGSGGEQSPR